MCARDDQRSQDHLCARDDQRSDDHLCAENDLRPSHDVRPAGPRVPELGLPRDDLRSGDHLLAVGGVWAGSKADPDVSAGTTVADRNPARALPLPSGRKWTES